MPRTKRKPEPPPPPPAPAANGPPAVVPAGEVLTLSEAAAYLRFSEGEVLQLVHDQNLPARRLANQWRFLKSAIQQCSARRRRNTARKPNLPSRGPGKMIRTSKKS